jgi:hypothetical protein
MDDGTLKLSVSAPPEGGRANAAVLELLAEILGLRPRQLQLVRGASSRAKVVEVEGLEAGALTQRLDRALESAVKGKGADGE